MILAEDSEQAMRKFFDYLKLEKEKEKESGMHGRYKPPNYIEVLRVGDENSLIK
ncbi:hypothetical protein [Pontibacillus salipaludis]|uniref:Uncharacterized protein n=1 Tax=Pontibacillus salipaludis TaxID=1697394 RepID=A0ABQ1PZC9_9BACI|nr:hypothetical protein [Pontibacillus salipaludis]GGD07860.1 hypothetical protein GCM10011389_14240 [Pontibacillus salipaludis]